MNKTEINITLIGAGNAATYIGIALKQAGYNISQVYSRTRKSATKLAKLLNTEPITDLQKISDKTDLFIIAVKDDVITELIRKINFGNALAVHTSGSTDMNVLKGYAKNYGVFYPLQTFSFSLTPNLLRRAQDKLSPKERGTRTLKNAPICIEANNKKNRKILEEIANVISGNVICLNSKQRQYVHLAAVFACNFSNHLYSVAENILKEHKIPFNILLPLIEETANKTKTISPGKAQTGPAKRGDKKIIQLHLKLLGKDKKLKEIYNLISSDIQYFDKLSTGNS